MVVSTIAFGFLQNLREILSHIKPLHSPKNPHTDTSQTLAAILESTPTPEKPWNERWAIMLKDENKDAKLRMIGVVGLVREPEIGYKLHPDFWGKGYMSEALDMFIKMWFGMESSYSPPSSLISNETRGVVDGNLGSVENLTVR